MRYLFLFLLMTGFWACGGDDDGKNSLENKYKVITRISSRSVIAGSELTVRCQLLDKKNEVIANDGFSLQFEPDSIPFNGLVATPTKAGDYTVACVHDETGLVDHEPPSFTVFAGQAVGTFMAFEPPVAEAGESVQTICHGLDAYGNPSEYYTEVKVTPAEGYSLGESTITVSQAGTYEGLCSALNLSVDNLGTAQLTVTAGKRVGIRLATVPEPLAFDVGAPFNLIGMGIDRFGNDTGEEVELTAVSILPDDALRSVGSSQNRFAIDEEGFYTAKGTAADDPSQSAERVLVVDETAPEIVLESPPRAMVLDNYEEVLFSGRVTDNLGEVALLRVADHEIEVKEDGHFEAFLPLAYGLNLFDVVAQDPYGLETLVTRTVEASTAYTPMRDPSFETDATSPGLALVLSQEAFDDGNPNGGSLAALMKLIVENLDLRAILGESLASCATPAFPNCTIEIDDFSIDEVTVHMTLDHGLVHFSVDLDGVAMTIGLHINSSVNLPGTITFSRAHLKSDLVMTVKNGTIDIATKNTEAELSDFQVDIHDPTQIAQALLSAGVDIIRNIIEGGLEAVIETMVDTQLRDTMANLFETLDIDQEFDVPGIGEGALPNTLVIRAKPKAFDIDPERLQLRVDTLAFAKFPERPSAHFGSILREGCEPQVALTYPPRAPMVVALHDDLINQLLFGLWEGGSVNVVLGPEESESLVGSFGLKNADIAVNLLLPPVFNSCSGSNIVQLGGLHANVAADMFGERTVLDIWLQAEAGLDIVVNENEEGALVASLEVGSISPLFLEVVENKGLFEGDDAAVRALVDDVLIPQLLELVSESAHFTLPNIDLGAMTNAVPPGTVINLDIREITRDSSYLTIEGALK